MTSESGWLLLSDAFARLDAGPMNAARDIICRGEVPVRALRSDILGSTTSEPVEKLLAQATRADVVGDDIMVHYEPGQDIKSILGPRSNMRNENVVAWRYRTAVCSVICRDACVRWPGLVEALAAAGFAVGAESAGFTVATDATGASETIHRARDEDRTADPDEPKPEVAARRGRGGRRKRSGEIDDNPSLRAMLEHLAAGEPSIFAAAGKAVETNFVGASRESARRRLARKFSARFGREPPREKTWKDLEQELNSNSLPK